MSASSFSCASKWMFKQHTKCEDQANPVYNLGQGPQCGQEEKLIELPREHQFKACEDPNHGLLRWELVEAVPASRSSWKRGGSTPRGYCTSEVLPAIVNKYQPNVSLGKIKVHLIKSNTEYVEKTHDGRVYYYYSCNINVYKKVNKTKRTHHCGPEPVKKEVRLVDRFCRDKEFLVEYYPITRGKYCPIETAVFFQNLSEEEVSQKIESHNFIESSCTSCSNIDVSTIEGLEERATCLMKNIEIMLDTKMFDKIVSDFQIALLYLDGVRRNQQFDQLTILTQSLVNSGLINKFSEELEEAYLTPDRNVSKARLKLESEITNFGWE